MAPFSNGFLEARRTRNFDLGAPSASFKAVWTEPSNYAFTILLLLGGDVVGRALAQLAGGRFTPVAFSFGMSFVKCFRGYVPLSLYGPLLGPTLDVLVRVSCSTVVFFISVVNSPCSYKLQVGYLMPHPPSTQQSER
jgi:hypothetical protein